MEIKTFLCCSVESLVIGLGIVGGTNCDEYSFSALFSASVG
jgi:hypothetical protein